MAFGGDRQRGFRLGALGGRWRRGRLFIYDQATHSKRVLVCQRDIRDIVASFELLRDILLDRLTYHLGALRGEFALDLFHPRMLDHRDNGGRAWLEPIADALQFIIGKARVMEFSA